MISTCSIHPTFRRQVGHWSANSRSQMQSLGEHTPLVEASRQYHVQTLSSSRYTLYSSTNSPVINGCDSKSVRCSGTSPPQRQLQLLLQHPLQRQLQHPRHHPPQLPHQLLLQLPLQYPRRHPRQLHHAQLASGLRMGYACLEAVLVGSFSNILYMALCKRGEVE